MTTESQPIAIVGAGIAGLSATWALQQAGHTCVVLEASARAGGIIASERAEGFLLEGGPDSFLASKPAAVELCRELGLEDELIGTQPQPGGPRLLHRGRLRPLPAGWRMLAPTRLGPVLRSPLFSPAVKAVLLWRWLQAPVSPRLDETVAAYLERRFGRRVGQAFTRTLVQPLMAGVYGGDADRLAAAEMQPGAQPQPSPAANGSIFLSLRGGMGSLSDRLVEHLEPSLRWDCRVQRVTRAGEGFRLEIEAGKAITAAGVVLAAPAWCNAELLRTMDAELAAPLAQIPFASSVNISLAFRRAPAQPAGHGFLASEGNGLLACTFAHQKFAGRAPKGGALLRLFYGEGLSEATDGLVEARVRADLSSMLGVTEPPDFIRIRRCPRAMPQYTVGHRQRVQRVAAALEQHPRLALAGNAYAGVGVPDCIASGLAAAAKLVAALG